MTLFTLLAIQDGKHVYGAARKRIGLKKNALSRATVPVILGNRHVGFAHVLAVDTGVKVFGEMHLTGVKSSVLDLAAELWFDPLVAQPPLGDEGFTAKKNLVTKATPIKIHLIHPSRVADKRIKPLRRQWVMV